MKPGSALHRLAYFATDAWDEWRHSPGVNLLALATLAAALFVAGLVTLVLANVGRHLDTERGRVQVHVYFRDAAGADARERVREELARTAGVAAVESVDPAEALRRYRTWAARNAALADELETNPLPASLDVTLAPGPNAERVAQAILAGFGRRPEVEDVRFDREWLERVGHLLSTARLGGGALAALVFAAVGLVMAGVLRLAVHARRDEIEIMLLVGATPWFVRGPFLVAGLAQGALAVVLALAGVEAARRGILAWTAAEPAALVGLAAGRPLPASASGMVCAVGIVVSLLAATLAVRRSA
jgi:cell division transport system permease protein